MTNFRLQRADDGVQNLRATLRGNGIDPLIFAADIKTALTKGGHNDLDSILQNHEGRIDAALDQSDLINILGNIDDVVNYQRFRGPWQAIAYESGEIVKAADGEYYEALQDLADTVAEPTRTTADWQQLAAGLTKTTAIFHDYLTRIGSHNDSESIRSELLQLVESGRFKGDFAAGATYAVHDEIESTDAHFYVRLVAGTEGTNSAAPTATTAAWRKVANGSLESEIIAFHKSLLEIGRIFEEDWGTLPVGTRFRIGNMAKRFRQWFICEADHTKGAVGPDNDPTRWSPITNFANEYDAAKWYHAGIYVTYRSKPAFSLEDITPSDPAPDHFENTKWWYPPNEHSFEPWMYREPASGVPDLEIDSQDANNGVVEHITNTLDADQSLVRSIRAAQDAGLLTALRISATLKYFLKQDAPLSASSGAILSVDTWLGVSSRAGAGVSTHAAPARFLVKIDDNDLTLADFRTSNGGRDAYGTNPDITRQLSLTFGPDDFHAWNLRQGEALDLILLGGNVNGFASVKLEIDDVAISYDLSTASHYDAVREIVEDGDRISWLADDDAKTITPVIEFPPNPEPLRYRAVISDDVRETTEKYQIEYGGTSFTVPHSAGRINTFTPVHPHLPDGYDATKVNLVYDGGDHQFNPSGDTDFTAESAGSTTRILKCTLEIAPDPSQERSNNDVIELGILVFGRARSSVSRKRLAFSNHQTYPFKIHFDLTYTGTPRSGVADAIAFTLQSDISRIKVIPKLTYYLPFTGASLPTQTYDQPGTAGHVVLGSLSQDEHAQVVPEDLVRALAGGRMALWEIPSGGANNEGRNAPTEEDHSDSVRAALGSHGNVFIEATQDLSQLHMTLRQKAAVSTSASYEIYLCTYLRGVLKPTVVAHANLFSGPPQWTIDYLGTGILKGQRFFLLSRGVIGDAEMVWDATIQDAVRTVTVKPGFTSSREIVLGAAANTFTLGAIANLPPVETWVKLRVFSSGLVTTVDWPENYLEGFPISRGQPSLTHMAIGPVSVHDARANGNIVHNRFLVPWQDGADWKVSVYDGASLDSVWLDRVEIEYELLN